MCVTVVHRFFADFDTDLGYIMYGLNTLLSLTLQHQFTVQLWEWTALLATALHQFDPDGSKAKFTVKWKKPTIRCLMLANWYQVLLPPILLVRATLTAVEVCMYMYMTTCTKFTYT